MKLFKRNIMYFHWWAQDVIVIICPMSSVADMDLSTNFFFFC